METTWMSAKGSIEMLARRWAAGVGAAVIAAALAACGSGAGPVGTATSMPSAASASPAAFNAADVVFTIGMLRLDDQAEAMAGLVAGHTASSQLRRFAAGLRGHDGAIEHMRQMMGKWHQPVPAPYTPGATPVSGMGPGMMDSRDWGGMAQQYGHEFNGHWLDAMIANHSAQIALCRAELRSDASPQARALARAMLAQRQGGFAQLQRWHHGQQHNGVHG
jgi:uncharacterized protein (DUF305 family)